MDLERARVMVTGGAGFLGRFVQQRLRTAGCAQILAPRSSECDLRERAQIDAYLSRTRPDAVVHLAAIVGGIGANQASPGRFLYENAIMGLELMEMARRHGVKKVLVTGTICSYPKITRVPFNEDDLWLGYPEETNAPYGLAKKLVMVQGEAYRRQYGLAVVNLLLVNLYGPGDNFSPDSSHVIPALIKKCVEAKRRGSDHVEVWGDGTATREFLYVRDAADAIVTALAAYDKEAPMNVGSGMEISIKDLVEKIASLVGFTGEIRWDTTKPNGQPRRLVDSGRVHREIGWSATTSFDQGLGETIAWYVESTDGDQRVPAGRPR
ncbi:MAG: GDP-L-fucose synthase [Candidatus Riflebacteria bacterium]|nr:GDP-L-fucose synthase [Candidatus Riflebacteria bacterium]